MNGENLNFGWRWKRRDPDILYLNWIGVLDANPADSRHMVEGFVDATEYRNRFKQ